MGNLLRSFPWEHKLNTNTKRLSFVQGEKVVVLSSSWKPTENKSFRFGITRTVTTETRGSWALNDVLIWPLADLSALPGRRIVPWRWHLMAEWHVFRLQHITVVRENLAWTPLKTPSESKQVQREGFTLLRERERVQDTISLLPDRLLICQTELC